jgi:hypothetical protein
MAVVCSACRSGDDAVRQGSGARAARPASSGAADRLDPGELAAGKTLVFGFSVPREMTVERRFHNEAHLSGSVSQAALIDYVRKRVAAAHVELAGRHSVFDNVRITGGDPQRLYRFEVVPDGTRTRLVIRDVTPPPTVQGISEAERWRRAGLTPDGRLLDPKKLE